MTPQRWKVAADQLLILGVVFVFVGLAVGVIAGIMIGATETEDTVLLVSTTTNPDAKGFNWLLAILSAGLFVIPGLLSFAFGGALRSGLDQPD